VKTLDSCVCVREFRRCRAARDVQSARPQHVLHRHVHALNTIYTDTCTPSTRSTQTRARPQHVLHRHVHALNTSYTDTCTPSTRSTQTRARPQHVLHRHVHALNTSYTDTCTPSTRPAPSTPACTGRSPTPTRRDCTAHRALYSTWRVRHIAVQSCTGCLVCP
jgi:hypothetical protein